MSLKSSILNFIRRINGTEKVFDELNKIKTQIISEVESKINSLLYFRKI